MAVMRTLKVMNYRWFGCLSEPARWLNIVNKRKAGKEQMWTGGRPCCRRISLMANTASPSLSPNYARKSELQMRKEHAVGNRRHRETEGRWERGGNRNRNGSDHSFGLLWVAQIETSIVFLLSTDLTHRSQFLFLFPNQNLQLQKSCTDKKKKKKKECARPFHKNETQ